MSPGPPEIRTPVVLVVEDEPIIRLDVVDRLEARDLILFEAGTVEEALETLTHQQRIDIVFTDVDMPGDLNGLDLAWKVHELWPAIGIIVTSGKAVIAPEQLPPGSHFYAKPYTDEAIQSAVSALLA